MNRQRSEPPTVVCPKCGGSGNDPDAAEEGFDRACSLCGGLGTMPNPRATQK